MSYKAARHRREPQDPAPATVQESLEADGVAEFGDVDDDDFCPVCDTLVFGGLASFDQCAAGVPHG